MRRGRLWGTITVLALAATGALAGIAAADPAQLTAEHAVADAVDNDSTLTCDGAVNATVTLKGKPETTGQKAAIVLVLDTSTSMAGSKITALKNAATAVLGALNAADGDGAGDEIKNNIVGIVTYSTNATTKAGLGSTSSYNGLVSLLPTSASGSSRHDLGISTASTQLAGAPTGFAKRIVMISDGKTPVDAQAAATLAEGTGVEIVTVGISPTTSSATNLKNWATGDHYVAAPLSGTKPADLVATLGALKVTPLPFTAVEDLSDTNFTVTSATPAPNETLPAKKITWTGTFTNPELSTTTLGFTAQRTCVDPVNVTTEKVSSLKVTWDVNVTAPTDLTIDVLPVGGSLLTKCTAQQSCGYTPPGGTGPQYALNLGSPTTPADVFLTGFDAPPAGVCPGFTPTKAVQFDIRPLTADATFEILIPKTELGSTKWWETKVCIGTNLPFVTAIDSLAQLRPKAVSDGSRYWGLLPSLPRLVKINGKWVVGPWITSRSPKDGGAVIKIKVPFVPDSKNAPENVSPGIDGFDPKVAH